MSDHPSDPFRLARFVEAQDRVYARVLAELRDGRKQSHWMWFVFPQIAGLGSSPMSQRFAIGSLDEAKAYLQHKALAPRLRECTMLATAHHDRTAEQIFGSVDAAKFRSSMTLFAATAKNPADFQLALNRHFAGEPDARTLALLTL